MPFDGAGREAESDLVLARLRLGRARIAAGWVKGGWRRDGGFCAAGAVALYFVAGDVPVLGPAGWAALQCLQAAAGRQELPRWNDRWWRRKRQVLALYDRAIAGRLGALRRLERAA